MEAHGLFPEVWVYGRKEKLDSINISRYADASPAQDSLLSEDLVIGGRTRLPSERKVDLVGGGDQISGFPSAPLASTRRVYHLAEFHDLPAFKIGKRSTRVSRSFWSGLK
jgi:hypothetical protein